MRSRAIFNRPGLPRLAYRIGTHGSILASMIARLSSTDHPSLAGLAARDPDDASIALLDGWATIADVLTFYQERIANEGFLRTAGERRSILELGRLVGWALRPGVSATAYLSYTVDPDPQDPNKDRLVTIPRGSQAQSVPDPGQMPRTPGTLVPLPQTFETAEDLEARAIWSRLEPRRQRPAWILPGDLDTLAALYLEGIMTNLKPDARLVLDFANPGPSMVRVASITADIDTNTTRVGLLALPVQAAAVDPNELPMLAGGGPETGGIPDAVLRALRKPPSIPPPNSRSLGRDTVELFKPGSDLAPRLLTTLDRRLAPTLYRALEAIPGKPSALKGVSAMRIKCQPFGATAPQRPVVDERGIVVGSEEWPLAGEVTLGVKAASDGEIVQDVVLSAVIGGETFWAQLRRPVEDHADTSLGVDSASVDWGDDSSATVTFDLSGVLALEILVDVPSSKSAKVQFVGELGLEVPFGSTNRRSVGIRRYAAAYGPPAHELEGRAQVTVTTRRPLPPADPKVIDLDAEYEGILPGMWVVIKRPGDEAPFIEVVKDVATVARSDYGLTAKVTRLWLSKAWLTDNDLLLSAIRDATVFVLSEPLALALEPVDDDICGHAIELQRVCPGLQSGRWIIVEGERTDVPGTSGVRTAELAMIAGVTQERDPDRDTDTLHTTLELASPLAFCYRRATAVIHGNVAKATHGETRTEVLGSGDSARALQAFPLRTKPLTYIPDSSALGAASTLELRVDSLKWHEAESLVDLGPKDHRYLLHTDDDDTTRAIFGTGRHGARPSSGQENVLAVYRTGTGIGGNVAAGKISQLMTRPLGVADVVNPLPSTGGADRESIEQGRRNLPLGVLALDRLVSVRDYEDFARARAGIGQASAVSISDGTRRVVHLTIAGAGDAPIDPSSDLYRSLREALQVAGDPSLPVVVAVRELALLVISSDVRIEADRRWDLMEPAIRAALLEGFSFDQRRLGQDVFVSEVQAMIQAVPGVVYSDLNILATVPESITPDDIHNLAERLTLPPTGRVTVSLARVEEPGVGLEALKVGERVTIRRGLLPAQLALLSPAVPDTLILRSVPS